MTPDLQPAGGQVFASAVHWLQATLLGTVATAVAVIAIASVGFLLMLGRIDVRRGAQVILGCFILFGASTIAGGIVGAITGADRASPADAPFPPTPVYPEAIVEQPTKAVSYDPYAGAAMPVRPQL